MHIKLWTTDAISRMDDASGGASGGGDSEDEVPLAVLAARQREKKRAEERRLRLSVSAASTWHFMGFIIYTLHDGTPGIKTEMW